VYISYGTPVIPLPGAPHFRISSVSHSIQVSYSRTPNCLTTVVAMCIALDPDRYFFRAREVKRRDGTYDSTDNES